MFWEIIGYQSVSERGEEIASYNDRRTDHRVLQAEQAEVQPLTEMRKCRRFKRRTEMQPNYSRLCLPQHS